VFFLPRVNFFLMELFHPSVFTFLWVSHVLPRRNVSCPPQPVNPRFSWRPPPLLLVEPPQVTSPGWKTFPFPGVRVHFFPHGIPQCGSPSIPRFPPPFNPHVTFTLLISPAPRALIPRHSAPTGPDTLFHSQLGATLSASKSLPSLNFRAFPSRWTLSPLTVKTDFSFTPPMPGEETDHPPLSQGSPMFCFVFWTCFEGLYGHSWTTPPVSASLIHHH